jgi:hypothetical protein
LSTDRQALAGQDGYGGNVSRLIVLVQPTGEGEGDRGGYCGGHQHANGSSKRRTFPRLGGHEDQRYGDKSRDEDAKDQLIEDGGEREPLADRK